jgi:hypothetical protein
MTSASIPDQKSKTVDLKIGKVPKNYKKGTYEYDEFLGDVVVRKLYVGETKIRQWIVSDQIIDVGKHINTKYRVIIPKGVGDAPNPNLGKSRRRLTHENRTLRECLFDMAEQCQKQWITMEVVDDD